MRVPSRVPRHRKSRRYEQFLEVAEPLQGFSTIAPSHYRSAVKLLQHADRVCAGIEMKFCYYVLSAICLFHASLECYLNEELALAVARLRDPSAGALATRCLALQDRTLGRQKLVEFLEVYGIRERIEDAIIEDVIALCELRDRLYHHSPEMMPTNRCPEAAIVVLRKADVAVINTSWTNLVSHQSVGGWARAVTERFVETHHAIKGWPPPFAGGPFAWNHDYDAAQ